MPSYYRPAFNHRDVDDARPKNQIQTKHPLVLLEMLISILFICLAGNIFTIYESNPEHCPFEIVMIAHAFHFVQYEVDINNPDMIREFMTFFQSMFVKYAVRYVVKDEKEKSHSSYINANLGEFYRELGKPQPKPIVHLTAFATKKCLARKKVDADDRVNHIDHTNHSIRFQRDMIWNAIRSITNSDITEDSFDEVVDKRIALADLHTRSDTGGKGNSFHEFRKEVDEDPELSEFCKRYKHHLKLDSTLKMGSASYDFCKPLVIDVLLGIFNFVLYALYAYAMTKSALRVFFASTRSHAVFESVGGNPFTTRISNLLVASFGIHPNAVELI